MKSGFRTFLANSALLICGAFLFALSHPNFIFYKGFPFLAYFAFIPLFVLVHNVSFLHSFLWGGIYGAFSYFLFGLWLSFFHPLAIQIVVLQYFLFFALLFPLLKIADIRFPKYGFFLQWLIFLGYEYIKTLGFMGFSYGIIGYSQWSIPPIIQIASLFGVWCVSALVLFPSVLIAAFINLKYELKCNCGTVSGNVFLLKSYKKAAGIWLGCFIGCFVFGFISMSDYSNCGYENIVLIQHNEDPWADDSGIYRQNFEKLRNLSEKALTEYPDTKLVVWPETAFVTRIEWHYKYRESPEAFGLVSDLLQYINSSKAAFLIGNDDAVLNPSVSGIPEFIKDKGRLDYNAALLFIPGKNVIPPEPERYRKMRLVPFTETFPYKNIFPAVYDFLLKNDTHIWEKGTDETVFSLNNLKFSVPICFEDTFGYISRRFANNGAEVIINITNDAWSKSAACQYQHLSMAVFRAVETRRPVLRAASSGQTAHIDRNGKILQMLPPFEENFLAASVPIARKNIITVYMKCGDVFGFLCAALSFFILIFIFIKDIIFYINRRKLS